jgi:type I restriction enzyme S subunit
MEMLDIEVFEGGFKETELGPLPEEWEVVRLGEILEEKNEKVGDYDFKDIVILSITSKDGLIEQNRKFKHRVASQNISNYKLVRRGELVYGFPIDEGVIAFLWRYEMGAVSPAYYTWKLKNPEKTYYIFLDYLLRTPIILNLFKPFISNTVHRRKIIKPHDFKQISIPLPPLEEQKAIAGILSTVQSDIEKTEKVINALKNLKKSMMKHLFTYGPVAEEEAEKVELKETEIGLIPKHWEVVRLGEVYNITKKPKGLRIENYDAVPFVPMEGIGIGAFSVNFIIKDPEEISSGTYFEKGDLLLAKITPSFENGKQAIADNIPIDFGIATTEVIPIKQTEKGLISYLFYYLQKPDVRQSLASKMEGTTGRQRLPKEALLNTLIPLPSLEEQQKIAQILQNTDQRIEKEEKYKNALQNLFKSLLHNLMTGKIRVRVKSHGED